MPNLLTRALGFLPGARPGASLPKLSDPADPKAEVLPADLAEPAELPNEQKRRMVEHIQSCYKAAAAHRRQRAYLWEQCKRFDEGEQWYLINDVKGIIDDRDEEDLKRCITFNHITRLVTKMEAMATQSEPEAYPVPVSDTPIDREACKIAEAIAADEYRKLGINGFRSRQARSALVQTSSYRYWTWDKSKEALIPQYDINGNFLRAVKAPVGGPEIQHVPGRYVFWDPAAQTKDDATWVCIVRTKPLVALQQAYGKAAYGVQPDTTMEGNSVQLMGDNSQAGGVLSALGGNKNRPNAALTIEYLEKPNPKHPQGVYAVVAGQTLVQPPIPWPWADKEHWPLAEMAYLPLDDSPYAQSCVEHLIEAQSVINRELSRIASRLDKDKRVVYVQRLSEIGADSFDELRDLIKIYYNPGSAPPTPSNLPPISPDHFTMLTMAIDFMQTFSGITDVLSGNVPPGVTAGVAIDMMIREASTQFKPFITSLEQCEVDFMRGIISEYADKAPLELMIGMDRKGNPRGTAEDRAPSAQALSLQALADGGMVDIYLVPGSGLPRSEAGKKAERTANYQAGLYGQPGSPEALKLYWEITDESDSHQVLESLAKQDQTQAIISQLQQQVEQLSQALEQAQKQPPRGDSPEDRANLAEHAHSLKMEAAAAADERKTKTMVAMELLKMQGAAARMSALSAPSVNGLLQEAPSDPR